MRWRTSRERHFGTSIVLDAQSIMCSISIEQILTTACVKSTCFNMTKAGYTVHVLSDCITSYDLKKLPEMLAYYESKGCEVKTLADYKQ